MNILFIHQNFPGQFIHLSAELAKDRRNRVVALGMNDHPVAPDILLRRYSLLRAANPETHPLLREQESHVLRAEACAAAAFQLKREGFVPDVIVAHPGWGEALFIKDVFPAAKLVIYCEYYYALQGQDVGFDPEAGSLTFQQQALLRLKNTTNLLSLQIADAAISPTLWQKSTYPDWAQDKISVIHDGIDTDRLAFNPQASVSLQLNGRMRQFRPGDEVLSYVARNLEPVRGFHIWMRTLPEVLACRPNAHAIIVGGNDVSYGHRAPGGVSWKDYMLAELGSSLDLARVHFVGKIPYASYLQLLSVSKVHTYWTTPFVLSWSLLEAALSGLPVIASDTAPLHQFASDLGIRLAGFFDNKRFANELAQALGGSSESRKPVQYLSALDKNECLHTQKKLLMSL
jgi:glycosyltransferase involved in cell wall biosynthesis